VRATAKAGRPPDLLSSISASPSVKLYARGLSAN
jgi:hypothetical protein